MQVALGLEYMQYMDLIYRDLKPENILINVNGYLKVSDVALLFVVVVVAFHSTLARRSTVTYVPGIRTCIHAFISVKANGEI